MTTTPSATEGRAEPTARTNEDTLEETHAADDELDADGYRPDDVVDDWDLNFRVGNALAALHSYGHTEDIEDLRRCQYFVARELRRRGQADGRPDGYVAPTVETTWSESPSAAPRQFIIAKASTGAHVSAPKRTKAKPVVRQGPSRR